MVVDYLKVIYWTIPPKDFPKVALLGAQAQSKNTNASAGSGMLLKYSDSIRDRNNYCQTQMKINSMARIQEWGGGGREGQYSNKKHHPVKHF